MFEVDFNKLIYNHLPHFMRKAKTLDYLRAIGNVLVRFNLKFNSFRTNILYKLTWTGQTIYLEHYLNDQFDPLNRAIFITNLNVLPFTYIFRVLENKTPFYLFRKSEGKPPVYFIRTEETDQKIHFEINVPTGLPINEITFNKAVEQYAQAAVNWQIIYF